MAVRMSKWRATVHYVDCRYYRCAVGSLEIPAGMPVRICRVCRPTEADIRTATPEVAWYPYSPDGRSKLRPARVVPVPLEWAEKLASRREMGWGRRGPLRPEGYDG